MANSADYDFDILEWSEEQAAALRKLAQARPDLSNQLDWENVAEEIEDVGRSELLSVQSYVRLILVHLIKAVSADSPPLPHWRKEVVVFRRNLRDRVTPSMLSRLDLPRLWKDAIEEADADLAIHGQRVFPALIGACPVTLSDLLDATFDFLKTAESIRQQLVDGHKKGR